jgi:uncharacterized protein (DUF2147 family)
MKFSPLVAAFGLTIAATTASFAAGLTPAGEWLVEDGSAVVRISKCGAGFCGFVARGQPGKDYRNPDPRKRERSVIGIQVFFSMRGGPPSWTGETYNADDGQIYIGKITPTGPSTLTVEGCVPGGGACGSQSWTRAR